MIRRPGARLPAEVTPAAIQGGRETTASMAAPGLAPARWRRLIRIAIVTCSLACPDWPGRSAGAAQGRMTADAW